MNVARDSLGFVICRSILAVAREWVWRLDDLHIQSRAEGLHVGDDKAAILLDVRGRENSRELCKAEGGEDSCNVCVVAEVEVQRLVERESCGIVVQSDVDLSCGLCDGMVLQTGKDFCCVADSDSSSCGTLEHVVTREAYIDRVLVALPFFVSEQPTESRVSESYCLVGTERLGIVGVCSGPVELHAGGVESLSGVSEVDVIPLFSGVGATLIDRKVGVVAIVISVEPYLSKGSYSLYTEPTQQEYCSRYQCCSQWPRPVSQSVSRGQRLT